MSAALNVWAAPPDADRTLSDFYRLTQPARGALCLFRRRDQHHLWTDDGPGGLVALTLANIDEVDLYCGTGSFANKESRKADNALMKRAFFADFDAGPSKVAKHGEKVYATGEVGDAEFVEFCRLTNLPPTLYLHSSEHGRHAYWCLTKDVPVEIWKSVAGKLARLFVALGVRADSAVTEDAARILRPPGAMHNSGHRVEQVMLAGIAPRRYSLAEFEFLVDAALLAADVPLIAGNATRQRAKLSALNADALPEPDEGVTPHTIDQLRAALAFLAGNGYGTGYEEWSNTGQALASLKGTQWEGAALDLFTRYSEQLPKFDGREAVERKWADLGGDRTNYKAIFARAYAHGWSAAGAGARADEANAGASPTPGESEETRPTDLALSKLWVGRYGDRFRYDHSRRLPMHFEAGAWRYCMKGQDVESFKGLALQIRREAGAAMAKDPGSTKTKAFLACADRAQSANGTTAALSLARSDPTIAVSTEDFDQDPDLFNVANGVIHLPSGELRAPNPRLMQHRQSPVIYDAGADCQAFTVFMDQVSCGDPTWVEYMQRFLGYALSGHVGEERAQFWLGVGANGKSVLANVCRHIWGTYGATAPSSFLMQTKRDASSATPELAMLPGVRGLSANETEAGSKLSAQTLKNVVSTEHMAARANYGNPFSFKPTHKLIIRGNHRPIITDDDEGIWRRIDLIPFDLKLTPEQRDTGLEARLLAEAPGILRWMVEGFARWRRDGLRPPKRIRDASLAYRQESDVLGQWIDECCEVGHGFDVGQRVAYAVFRNWCHEQGLRQVSKKSFTRSLRERGIGEGRETTGSRQYSYTGMRLKA